MGRPYLLLKGTRQLCFEVKLCLNDISTIEEIITLYRVSAGSRLEFRRNRPYNTSTLYSKFSELLLFIRHSFNNYQTTCLNRRFLQYNYSCIELGHLKLFAPPEVTYNTAVFLKFVNNCAVCNTHVVTERIIRCKNNHKAGIILYTVFLFLKSRLLHNSKGFKTFQTLCELKGCISNTPLGEFI